MKRLSLALFSFALACGSVFAADAEKPSVWKQYFPDGLIDKDGNAVELSKLEGKAVGIYFSAHWCGPCRAFTPSLVKFRDANQQQFEVVFVSSDRSADAQKKYMEEAGMKWYTMTLNSDAATALKEKFEVRGIPKLVLLKSTGDVLTGDGRTVVSSGVDASQIAHPKVSVKTVKEEYNCGRCNKIHTREVVKGLEVPGEKAAPAS